MARRRDRPYRDGDNNLVCGMDRPAAPHTIYPVYVNTYREFQELSIVHDDAIEAQATPPE